MVGRAFARIGLIVAAASGTTIIGARDAVVTFVRRTTRATDPSGTALLTGAPVRVLAATLVVTAVDRALIAVAALRIVATLPTSLVTATDGPRLAEGMPAQASPASIHRARVSVVAAITARAANFAILAPGICRAILGC
jgi:hypothetical protein